MLCIPLACDVDQSTVRANKHGIVLWVLPLLQTLATCSYMYYIGSLMCRYTNQLIHPRQGFMGSELVYNHIQPCLHLCISYNMY